jgi:serine/threonine protein kinase
MLTLYHLLRATCRAECSGCSCILLPTVTSFMEETCDLDINGKKSGREHDGRKTFLAKSIGCLTSAIAYVHDQTTKHMDYKPHNILVKKRNSLVQGWTVYLADFGLSHSFTSQGHSLTDDPTSRTPRYCAPEVLQKAWSLR